MNLKKIDNLLDLHMNFEKEFALHFGFVLEYCMIQIQILTKKK
jgi:hypothetical protein